MRKIMEMIETEIGPSSFMVLTMSTEEHERVHTAIHDPTTEDVSVNYVSNVANISPCVMEVCFSEMWGSREDGGISVQVTH
jgi:hypothetical protein